MRNVNLLSARCACVGFLIFPPYFQSDAVRRPARTPLFPGKFLETENATDPHISKRISRNSWLSQTPPEPRGRYRVELTTGPNRRTLFSVAGDVSVTLPTSRVPSLPSRLCPAPHQRLPHFRCRCPTCLPLTMPPSPPPLPQVFGPRRCIMGRVRVRPGPVCLWGPWGVFWFVSA